MNGIMNESRSSGRLSFYSLLFNGYWLLFIVYCYSLFPSLGKTTVGLNVLASSKSMWA